MKNFILICLMAYALPANAALITSNTTSILTEGQAYAETFVLDGSSYSDVVLSLTAKGDYGWSTGSEFETIDFYIDGTQVAHWINSHDVDVNETPLEVTSGISIVENFYEFDYTLSGDISISNALWESFAADGEINISWINGVNVAPYAVEGGDDFVSYSIAGNNVSAVPVPAAIWLFGTGLIGLAGVARRNIRT